MQGFIGTHVDDFLIGLSDGALGETRLSETQSLYLWSVWKKGEAEFAGIQVWRVTPRKHH